MQDFTCALATGRVYSIPFNLRLKIDNGNLPLVLEISAPISVSGNMTRPIGRAERETSPMSLPVTPCPDNKPEIKRVVVPELPQSKGEIGFSNSPPEI